MFSCVFFKENAGWKRIRTGFQLPASYLLKTPRRHSSLAAHARGSGFALSSDRPVEKQDKTGYTDRPFVLACALNIGNEWT